MFNSIRRIVFLTLFFSLCFVQIHGKEVSESRKALSEAIKKKNASQIRSLIASKEVGINELSSNSETPLMEAAAASDPAAVKYFIEQGAIVNFHEKDVSTTALYEALNHYNFDDNVASVIVKLLIDAGADLNNSGRSWKPTPFMKACEKHAVKCVQLFFDAGVDIESRDNEGKTPLIYSIYSGKSLIMTTLIQKGAKLESQDNQGKTALFYAVEKKFPLLVNLLIEAGANTQAVDFNGTPVFMYALATDVPALSGLFLKLTPDIKVVNYRNESALFYAAQSNDLKTAGNLLKEGMDINQKNSDGETPFLKAVAANKTEMALFLFDNGADITVTSYKGTSPLSTVVKKGNLTLLSLLIKQKIPLDPIDSYSFTPLMQAIINENDTIVQCLLYAGASTKTRTEKTVKIWRFGIGSGGSYTIPSGSTPLDIAKLSGNKNIIELLSEKN